MATEIQRKFLVLGWDDSLSSARVSIKQGYISTTDGTEVKVRLAGEFGFLTIKGKTPVKGKLRFTYPIPAEEAAELLESFCRKPYITKTRCSVYQGEKLWEVDCFGGENEGLIIAEIELDSSVEKLVLPPWIGEEVTDDPRYGNAQLGICPYKSWK